MKNPIIIIGLGEMGGVFARGFLKAGYPVHPVTRQSTLSEIADNTPSASLVLIAVGEQDLHSVLEQVPLSWHKHLALLQNELLPRDWHAHGLPHPTVISVWFEKKRRQDYKVLIPSPVYGTQASLLHTALSALDIPTKEINSESQLLIELVAKNVYILTTNIVGLEIGGTVEQLWYKHRQRALQIAHEVIEIQQWLCSTTLDHHALLEIVEQGIQGDLAHQCMGRSAMIRLQNALEHADQAGLAVTNMRAIQQTLLEQNHRVLNARHS